MMAISWDEVICNACGVALRLDATAVSDHRTLNVTSRIKIKALKSQHTTSQYSQPEWIAICPFLPRSSFLLCRGGRGQRHCYQAIHNSVNSYYMVM